MYADMHMNEYIHEFALSSSKQGSVEYMLYLFIGNSIQDFDVTSHINYCTVIYCDLKEPAI